MGTLQKITLLVLFSALSLTGCASKPKSYVVLLESPDGTTGQVVAQAGLHHLTGGIGRMHDAPMRMPAFAR